MAQAIEYRRRVMTFCACVGQAALAAGVVPSKNPNVAQTAPEFQNWDELDVYTQLTSYLDSTWVSQMRFSTQLPNPSVYTSGLDFNFKVTDFLIVTPSYYYSAFRFAGSSWTHASDPILAETLRKTWNAWTLSDRGRVAGVLEANKGYWIYLNRPRVDYALPAGRWDKSLYIWDEFSYYSDLHQWERNRLEGGARIGSGDKWAIDFYCIHQNDASAHPHQTVGLGVTLEVRSR